MKKLGFLCLLSLLSFVASAATVVRGVVKDSKGSAIGYATVAAEQSGAVVVALAAGADGRFSLEIKESGDYTDRKSVV